jgi:hypothetical protein
MRRFFVVLLLAAAALAPGEARAGLALGARLGAAIPGGEISNGDSLDGFVDWAVPVQIDLGYRLAAPLQLGAYLRIAPAKLDGSIADGCDAAGVECSAFDLGIGVQVDFRFSQGNAGPWLGGYAGYEQLRYEVADGANELSITAKGWELGAQGGIDFAWGALSLGPWGAIGIGQATRATFELNGTSDTQSIDDKGTHTWIQVGLRAGLAF